MRAALAAKCDCPAFAGEGGALMPQREVGEGLSRDARPQPVADGNAALGSQLINPILESAAQPMSASSCLRLPLSGGAHVAMGHERRIEWLTGLGQSSSIDFFGMHPYM